MKSKSGFTIVELLIVVIVIAILAAISMVAYSGIQTRANNAVVATNLRNTVTALENFNAIHGRYPVYNDRTELINSGLKLKTTLVNTLLYCYDTADQTTWLLLAWGYPSGTTYRWTSSGEKNSNSGVTIGSGGPTCQAQMGGSSTAAGLWAFSIATME